jgi:hypothetical protein
VGLPVCAGDEDVDVVVFLERVHAVGVWLRLVTGRGRGRGRRSTKDHGDVSSLS